MLVVVLVALSGCGGEGGTGLTSTDAANAVHATRMVAAHRHKALPEKVLPEQAWEGMPCGNSALITYGGCGAVP